MATTKRKPADFITDLDINGLQGRVMRLPAPKGKTRKILFVYGHHASLERFWGLAEALNDYGEFVMPDLPGFGGMDSFYKLGEKPTLDNLADYLASFVKLRYRRQNVTLIGFSLGFVIITRMLQRHPELVQKVDLLVSAVGFAHKNDFTFSKPRYMFYRYAASLFSNKLPAFFFRSLVLHPLLLKTFYSRTHNAKVKFADLSETERKIATDFEVHLWRINELRTYMDTTVSFLTLDNCRKRVDLPVWHVAVKADNYFDNGVIEQHMRVIFSDFRQVMAELNNHSMTVIADKNEAKVFLPLKLRRMLGRQPKKT